MKSWSFTREGCQSLSQPKNSKLLECNFDSFFCYFAFMASLYSMFRCICISLGRLLCAFNNSETTIQSTWNLVLGSLWEIVEPFLFVKFRKTTLRRVHFCLHILHAEDIHYPTQNTRLHLHWFDRWFVLFF